MQSIFSTTCVAAVNLYTDQDRRFSILVPVDWIVDSSGQQGTRVILCEPSAIGDFCANINVVVQALGAMTETEYLALSRLQVKQMSGRAKPDVDVAAAQLNNGRILEWHAMMGRMHLKIRQLIVVCGSSAFLVSATALYSRFSEYRKDFEAALDSFRVDEQTGVLPAGE